MTPYKLHLIIEGLPKTINSIGRKHFWLKVKEANNWKELVHAEIGSHLPTKPLSHAVVTLLRASSVCPDYDGLVSSFKHVVDGLVESGVLEDDSMHHIGMPSFSWKKAPMRKGYIEIQVHEVPRNVD